jgi:hypothetical protein
MLQSSHMAETENEPLSLNWAAYHEAGHALVALLFGKTLRTISIVPENELFGGGACYEDPHPLLLSQAGVYCEDTIEHDRFICHQIMITQAGEVAQTNFCPETVQAHHASFDRQSAQRYINKWSRNARPDEKTDKLEDLYGCTREVMARPDHAAAIHALTNSLLERKEVKGAEATLIIRGAIKEAKTQAASSSKPLANFKCPHCEADYE